MQWILSNITGLLYFSLFFIFITLCSDTEAPSFLNILIYLINFPLGNQSLIFIATTSLIVTPTVLPVWDLYFTFHSSQGCSSADGPLTSWVFTLWGCPLYPSQVQNFHICCPGDIPIFTLLWLCAPEIRYPHMQMLSSLHWALVLMPGSQLLSLSLSLNILLIWCVLQCPAKTLLLMGSLIACFLGSETLSWATHRHECPPLPVHLPLWQAMPDTLLSWLVLDIPLTAALPGEGWCCLVLPTCFWTKLFRKLKGKVCPSGPLESRCWKGV